MYSCHTRACERLDEVTRRAGRFEQRDGPVDQVGSLRSDVAQCGRELEHRQGGAPFVAPRLEAGEGQAKGLGGALGLACVEQGGAKLGEQLGPRRVGLVHESQGMLVRGNSPAAVSRPKARSPAQPQQPGRRGPDRGCQLRLARRLGGVERGGVVVGEDLGDVLDAVAGLASTQSAAAR